MKNQSKSTPSSFAIIDQPRSLPRFRDLKVSINGENIDLIATQNFAFANFFMDENPKKAIKVEISSENKLIKNPQIQPLRLGIEAEVKDNRFSFELKQRQKLAVNIDGFRTIYLWGNAWPEWQPDPKDEDLLYFASGQVYEVGKLEVPKNKSLFIEAGAVVRGRIIFQDSQNIRIGGHGILDGSYFLTEYMGKVPLLVLAYCQNVHIEDITMIEPAGWMLVPGGCEHVEIRNIKQIGEVVSSDGIDVVGSSHVHIEDCFLSNNDDCIVLKAFFLSKNNLQDTHFDFRRDIHDVVAENCILANGPAGNAMEIGHELSVDEVEGVTFRNMDVLSVHNMGAVFSLHNNDRAKVHNILFEDIRIDHCYDKFIDFRVSRSRYSSDEQRGKIEDVHLKNIHWKQSPFNIGYTISLIGGWSEEAMIQNIHIEDLYINDEKVTDVDVLEINSRYAKNIHLT